MNESRARPAADYEFPLRCASPPPAAAVIMVAAFSGFVAGRLSSMQEFGFGLVAAILFDATLIRAILVPTLMALLGRYNWWLPAPMARVVRVKPSPLDPREALAPGE